jgi:hypothetical protein
LLLPFPPSLSLSRLPPPLQDPTKRPSAHEFVEVLKSNSLRLQHENDILRAEIEQLRTANAQLKVHKSHASTVGNSLVLDRIAPAEKARTIADCVHNLVGLLIPALFLLSPAPHQSLSHVLVTSFPH